MPLQELVQGPSPAREDVQQTTFGYDVVGRYVCNNWDELVASQTNGYSFDAVVVGAGMFGAYCAEKLYRLGLRVLVLEAGGLLFPSHVQNLPQRLGGSIGGPRYNRSRDDGTGAQNVVWGIPWISNEVFPGLAYCVGGRSLFWGGWSPRLTAADLASWPAELRDYLTQNTDPTDPAQCVYREVETEIGAWPTQDYIHGSLFDALAASFETARAGINEITKIEPAPLAVQGESPGSGLFSFDKFSSAPWIIDAIRNDATVNGTHLDVSRRIFLVPRTQVRKVNLTGDTVSSLDVDFNGAAKTLKVEPGCAVVLANGTIEATRLALDSLGAGDRSFGNPRLGNLMAHLRSNITVRIKRSVLGLAQPTELETAALLVRGEAIGRRFHLQVTAAAVTGSDSEANMWSMNPDIDLLGDIKANQSQDWVVFTFRAIGEMEDNRVLPPDPARSWIDLSNETDGAIRRAYTNLVITANDRKLWTAMDKAALDLAGKLAKDENTIKGNIQFWDKGAKTWQAKRPQPNLDGTGPWQDTIGTTHHEAGPLFMGAPGQSITDLSGRFHNYQNAYVVGPAVFPTLGSANPSLTALSLARRTAQSITQRNSDPSLGFTQANLDATKFQQLSLDSKDWTMVALPNAPAAMKHHGKIILEAYNWYGLYWYMKESFADFILRVDWRVARFADNSGVYIRIPRWDTPDALKQADATGHEIQIDERGFDSNTGQGGQWLKITGALYDVQAPTQLNSKPVGQWNTFVIKAKGPDIEVKLNGKVVNQYTSPRRKDGYIALQTHDYESRTQFRNLYIQRL